MEGEDLVISTEERKALVEFRSLLADVLAERHYEDYQLVKWLRARKLDVGDAEVMFRESLEWRKSIGMDVRRDTYQMPEVFAKFIPQSLIGHAKDGSTVLLVKAGSADFLGLLKCSSTDAMIFYEMWIVEQCLKKLAMRTKETGLVATQTILIIDVKGYSFSQFLNFPVANLLRKGFSIYDSNYPETLQSAYVINVSGHYKMIFDAICRVSLSEKTCKKFSFHQDVSQFKDVLLEIIDADVLPMEYGGNRTDPDGDPTCRSMIVPGGPVPKFYYRDERLKSGEFENEVVINRRSNLQLEFTSAVPHATLHWEFLTVGGDIGFGIQYVNEKRSLMLNAPKRLPSDEEIITGDMVLREPGKYVVCFDNTYSYVRSKVVFYNITVF